jgi:hypothetical protein
MSYALVGLIAFAAAVPFLGIRDYLSFTRSGQDESEQVHRESIAGGMEYVGSHPLGSGAGNVGPIAAQRNASALITENTYLALTAEYGIAAGLCFVGFLLSAALLAWRSQTNLGNVGVGILVGISLMMIVLLVHEDFRLGCWIWFPIGLSIREASHRLKQHAPELGWDFHQRRVVA